MVVPVSEVNSPPTTTFEPSGVRTIALTAAFAVGAQVVVAPAEVNAASLVRATPLALLNAPPT